MRWMLLLLFCCVSTAVSAQAQFRVGSLIGPGDQQSMGLNKLDPDQQAALEAWINLWTIKTINQVLSMGCQCTTGECLNALYQNTASGQIDNIPSDRPMPFRRPDRLRSNDSVQQIETKDFSTISEILRNGGVIRLDNGAVWEVAPGFQVKASTWRRLDKVQLRPSTVYGRFVLNNLTRHQQIEVTQPGDPTHTDPYRSDPFRTDLYRAANTFVVRNILDEGETLILDNGSVFEVRLSDRKKYVKYWHPGISVEIFKKGGTYPFSLKEVQSGDSVSAKLKS